MNSVPFNSIQFHSVPDSPDDSPSGKLSVASLDAQSVDSRPSCEACLCCAELCDDSRQGKLATELRLRWCVQPASVITYTKKTKNKIGRRQDSLEQTCKRPCCAKQDLVVSLSMENKYAYCCLRVQRAGHSEIICISSATATVSQCVQTLLALATCCPPAERPRTTSN